MGGVEEDTTSLDLEARAEVLVLLKPRPSTSEGEPYLLTIKEWQTMCNYVHMLDSKLPELHNIIVASKDAMAMHLMSVEDELGSVLADLGTGEDVPGGPYVNV
jgi:hypothetical protein